MDASQNDGASAYYGKLAGALEGGARSYGVQQGWIAPVAVFDAPEGFGEECWFAASPVTVLATRLLGGDVEWLCGPATGRLLSKGNNVALQPRDCPNHARAAGPIRFAQTFLLDALVDRVADSIKPGATASGMMRDDLIFVRDREIEHLTNAHVRGATSGACALELEASAILLIGAILRRHHGFAAPQQTRGGLATYQLRRVCEAMLAHMDEDIRLDLLAGIAGCSPTHFSRAFKQSTGLAPFQWLQQQRINRAQILLAESRQSLAEIALATGFSSQAHFTTAFKRVTGLTPGYWRRHHRL